jgi:two-component system, chemotaxis family, chemotaxis protein CheY
MSKRVLVADDDKAMRTLLVHALGPLGIEEAVEAADGDEALALFQQSEFDLILLDLEMPGKTGLEVLRAIRSHPSDVPVIMVTAKRSRESVLEAAEAGVTDYLVKPIDQEVLKKKLAPHLRSSGVKINTSVYRCRNVMNSDVITIKPDATVDEAIALLLQHGISGLPVVDDQNRLLGVVTEFNLLQSITQPDLKSEPVSRVMSTEVMTVDEDTIPLKVVNIMQEHHVRRVPVVRDNELVGLISRRDILRYVTENEDVLRGFLEELRSLAGK